MIRNTNVVLPQCVMLLMAFLGEIHFSSHLMNEHYYDLTTLQIFS